MKNHYNYAADILAGASSPQEVLFLEASAHTLLFMEFLTLNGESPLDFLGAQIEHEHVRRELSLRGIEVEPVTGMAIKNGRKWVPQVR
jgi:hypothetical protein